MIAAIYWTNLYFSFAESLEETEFLKDRDLCRHWKDMPFELKLHNCLFVFYLEKSKPDWSL